MHLSLHISCKCFVCLANFWVVVHDCCVSLFKASCCIPPDVSLQMCLSLSLKLILELILRSIMAGYPLIANADRSFFFVVSHRILLLVFLRARMSCPVTTPLKTLGGWLEMAWR